MSLSDKKIIQSLIQQVLIAINLVELANLNAQYAKTRYQTLNPDLSASNLTSGQINAIVTFINDLNTLASQPIVTTLKQKDFPSHGIKALE